jgi:hypothetical protein
VGADAGGRRVTVNGREQVRRGRSAVPRLDTARVGASRKRELQCGGEKRGAKEVRRERDDDRMGGETSAKVHSRGQRSTLATGWPRSGHHSATISSCERIPRGLGSSTLTISGVNARRTRTWGRILLCSRPRHRPVRPASRPPLALQILFREHQVRFRYS